MIILLIIVGVKVVLLPVVKVVVMERTVIAIRGIYYVHVTKPEDLWIYAFNNSTLKMSGSKRLDIFYNNTLLFLSGISSV
ncbi:MAG: hypothetical protein LBQ60_20790 [Bacteroidales bacterium]|nr:hypothetical protein [Bacteroidales bacterium]